jgi:hypothetical protein
VGLELALRKLSGTFDYHIGIAILSEDVASASESKDLLLRCHLG